MRAIINSIKHYFHTPVIALASGAVTIIKLSSSIAEGAARANATDVYEGSKITAMFLEYWISGVTLNKTATWCIIKLSGGAIAPTFAEMANLGSYANKKNILNAGQGIPPTNGNVMNIYKGWIKIPKGKQRQGLKDEIVLVLAAVGTVTNICGLLTFKELS